jgi:hypothetical protein
MSEPASLEADLAAGVSSDRLMAHMREFARRIKLSGTAEELASFRYLKAELEAIGYATQLLSHDAYISLPGPARIEIDGKTLTCITHSMSRSTPPSGVIGDLVYVREGRAEDIAAVDARGKILLVDGIATPEVAAFASAAGALGQIHVSPNEHRYEMCVSPVWGSPSQHTRSELPTTVICTIAQGEGEILRARCGRGETVRPLLFAEVDTGWRKTPILVAELPPPQGSPDASFVLFSGHHDTWHYGVMDNGGANATMLEAARLLAERRESWRRGLRICFWSGHSHGRYSGSAWYADTYWHELEQRCAAHVNVDSTGGESATVLTNSGVAEELREVAASAILAETGQVHAGRRQGRAADQSFWGVGIPSMFGSLSHQPPGPVKMLVALGWWWHTPQDLIDHIDPDNLARDTRIIVRVLARLLGARVLPLDYCAYTEALLAEIAQLETALAGDFDLADLRAAAIGVANAAARLAGLVHVSDAKAEEINAALMRASRALVPFNYTSGERFRYDPALPQPAWPTLRGLWELAGEDASSPDRPFFVVHARQTCNRAIHVLRQARAALLGAV